MVASRYSRTPPLALVAVPPAEETRRADGGRDWSKLMARAQDGDRGAYRALLKDLVPYIRSVAGRRLKESSDVEDVVQDVLMTVHMVRHAYDPSRPFGPWLLAIANRRIIDRLRRQTREKARKIALSAEYETFSGVPANLDQADFEEAVLGEAIERLPPEQRQAIKMLKLNEMSLREAAAASGRSIAALKAATHRAIRSLRRMLRDRSDY